MTCEVNGSASLGSAATEDASSRYCNHSTVSISARRLLSVRQPVGVEFLGGTETLHEVVAVSDIVILTLPLNASTHHWIDRSVLQAMPRGSYLINVARGQVIDEPALIEA